MAKRNPQINIRVPETLKRKLHESAAARGQSVNSEIVRRLWDTFESEDKLYKRSRSEVIKAMVALAEQELQDRDSNGKRASNE